MKIWVMMIGEMEFTNIFHAHLEDPSDQKSLLPFEEATYTIYAMFLILVAIIVMNLITGLAVSDVAKLQQDSSYRMMAMQIDLALDVEFSLPNRFRKKWCALQYNQFEMVRHKESSTYIFRDKKYTKDEQSTKEMVEQSVFQKGANKFIEFWGGNLYKNKLDQELIEIWKKNKRLKDDKLEDSTNKKFDEHTLEY